MLFFGDPRFDVGNIPIRVSFPIQDAYAGADISLDGFKTFFQTPCLVNALSTRRVICIIPLLGSKFPLLFDLIAQF